MQIKHFEDEDESIRDETISIKFYIPAQPEIDDGEFPDFYIKLVEDAPGFVCDPLYLFLEKCEEEESAEAVISWLEYYIDEIKKRYP